MLAERWTSKKELGRNTGDQKHCNRNENAFDGFICRLDIAEEGLSELEHISTKTY